MQRYTMYTGDMMKKNKKTEFISVRTDAETKAVLEKIADERKWSISLLVDDIIQKWLAENKQNEQ